MSDNKFGKLELSDDSLSHLLNFILSMVQEDRKNALDMYDTLAGMVTGPGGFDNLGAEGIMISDITNGLTAFLKNSSQSTEQAIKIANVMANHLVKMDRSATLTDADREEIAAAAEAFKNEKKEIDNILKVGFK